MLSYTASAGSVPRIDSRRDLLDCHCSGMSPDELTETTTEQMPSFLDELS